MHIILPEAVTLLYFVVLQGVLRVKMVMEVIRLCRAEKAEKDEKDKLISDAERDAERARNEKADDKNANTAI